MAKGLRTLTVSLYSNPTRNLVTEPTVGGGGV